MTQELRAQSLRVDFVQTEPKTAAKRREIKDKESRAACSVGKESLISETYRGTTKEEAQELVRKHRDYLKDPNIVCLSVGPKKKNGEKTGRLALIFDVVEKKDFAQLPEMSRKIPKQVPLKKKENGETRWIDTDVVETGKLIFNRAEGGSAIWADSGPGNPPLGLCTLGAIVPRMFGDDAKAKTKTGKTKLQLITSAHLIDYDEQHIGRQLRYLERSRYVALMAAGQPLTNQEFLGPDQVLFPVTDFHPVHKYRRNGDKNEVYNDFDILWADVDEPEKVSETILGQPYGGIREPQEGEKFTLAGITTGVHENCTGFFASAKMTGEDSEGEYDIFWKNLIRYDVPTRPGDSGAALVSETDGKIIGLHAFGSNDGNYGYACQLPTGHE